MSKTNVYTVNKPTPEYYVDINNSMENGNKGLSLGAQPEQQIVKMTQSGVRFHSADLEKTSCTST